MQSQYLILNKRNGRWKSYCCLNEASAFEQLVYHYEWCAEVKDCISVTATATNVLASLVLFYRTFGSGADGSW